MTNPLLPVRAHSVPGDPRDGAAAGDPAGALRALLGCVPGLAAATDLPRLRAEWTR
jgi:hypothetical protein